MHPHLDPLSGGSVTSSTVAVGLTVSSLHQHPVIRHHLTLIMASLDRNCFTSQL